MVNNEWDDILYWENPTILKEAARVLKPGGRFVSVSRHTAWLRRHDIFEKYGVNENRLYSV